MNDDQAASGTFTFDGCSANPLMCDWNLKDEVLVNDVTTPRSQSHSLPKDTSSADAPNVTHAAAASTSSRFASGEWEAGGEEVRHASTYSMCPDGVPYTTDALGDVRTHRSPLEFLSGPSATSTSRPRTYSLPSGCGRGGSCISAAETLVNAQTPELSAEKSTKKPAWERPCAYSVDVGASKFIISLLQRLRCFGQCLATKEQ